MSRKIIRNLTLDESYLKRYEDILAHNPRIKGNVSLAIREYIKSMVDEEEQQKKVEAQHKIFSREVQVKPNILEEVLSYIFNDVNRYIQFNQWDELTLLEFIIKTRETSKHAESVFKNRFHETVYLNDKLLLKPKERLGL